MAYGSALYTFGGYIQSNGTSLAAQQRDVSVIKLDSNLGNSTGWFGYTTAKSSYLRLNGYDGDTDNGRTLVTRYGTNTWIDSGILKYPGLTAGDFSGGGAKINNAIFDFMSKY